MLLVFMICMTIAESKEEEKFEKMPKPQPGEWLSVVREKGQTFEQYKKEAGKFDKKASIVYIQPLGEILKDNKQVIETMKEYIAVFYGLTAKILEPIELPKEAFNKERNQYDAGEILVLLSSKIPEGAAAYVGFTEEDLFSHRLNFVFGLGSSESKTGVYSLNRYFQKYDNQPKEATLMRRSLNVAVHELGHIFYMEHCIFYRCIMNGSNSLTEADKRPMHLCPVCLKKTEWYFKLDKFKRYEKLSEFYQKKGFEADAKFVKDLLKEK